MKVILHIGMHKAASSSIQKFVQSNTDVLADHGVIVPLLAGRQLAHRGVVWDVFDYHGYTRNKYYHGAAGKFLFADKVRQIYASRASDPNSRILFLTSEVFENYSSRPRHFNKLQRWLRNFTDQAEFLIIVRDQASRANSTYGQAAKTLRTAKSFETWRKGMSNPRKFDYRQRYKALDLSSRAVRALAFPEFVAREIELSLAESVFGLSANDLAGKLRPAQRMNTNPGPRTVAAGIEIRRRINERLIRRPFPDPLRHAVRLRFLKLTRRLGWNERGFCGLDDNAASEIMTNCAAVNDAFAELVWGGNWSSNYAMPSFEPHTFDLKHAGRRQREEFEAVIQATLADFDEAFAAFELAHGHGRKPKKMWQWFKLPKALRSRPKPQAY